MVGCCEHVEEPLGSVKGREFIDHGADHQLL
jgi:hypothetical protein